MSSSLSDLVAAGHPLTDPKADTLGRYPFAERLAAELVAQSRGAQLVVSLNGECGGGKTTCKNFARHALAQLNSPEKTTAAVVDVNLAELPQGDSIAREFCLEIARQLGVPNGNEVRALESGWQQVAQSLGHNLAATENAPGFRAARDALRAQLGSLPFCLIVLTDDLDRLAANRITDLLHFLGLLSLGNVAFFLPMQKRIVAAALGLGVDAGAAVLRQHIHLELELPDAPDSLLRRQLEAGLEEKLNTVTFPTRPRERWAEVLGAAVWPLFTGPRDVPRFLSALSFQFGSFFDPQERVLEVNPTDLVLLEAVRMFAPTVYSDLRDTFRRRETRIVRLMSGRDEERKEVRVEIDGSVERLPLSSRQKRAVTVALQQLVPLGTGGVHGAREDWDRDLRFCSPRHVERYFHLGATVDAVPATRLVALARSTGDREKLETLLRNATRDNMLPEVLDRLPALIQGLPENQLTIAAVVLCGMCDQIPAHAPDDLEARLVRFGSELFAQVKNPLRRENIVAALLEDPNRLTGPILLLHALRPRSDGPNGANSATLSIEQFRRLIKSAVDKLQDNANSGAIWRSREAGALVKRWWEWSTEKDDVQRWLAGQVKEPEHARTWLRSFVSASSSAPGKEVILQFEDLTQYCDPNTLAAAATQANGDHIDRATAKRLGQVVSNKGTAAGFALRMITVPLDEAA